METWGRAESVGVLSEDNPSPLHLRNLLPKWLLAVW